MYFSMLSILLPLLMGAIFFKWLSNPLKWLFFFIVVGAIFEGFSLFLNLKHVNNLFLFHLFIIFEFGFLSVVLWLIFQVQRYRMFISVISIPFTMYLVASLFTSDLTTFNDQNRIIESSILILYCILYIVMALKRLKASYLEMHPYFILISGLLIYFAGTISVFIFSNQLDHSNFMPAWTVHSLLNIFLKLVYTSVIWRSKLTSRI